mgnify:CR=1 FL=1
MSCDTGLEIFEMVLPIGGASMEGISAVRSEGQVAAQEGDVALSNSFAALGEMEDGLGLPPPRTLKGGSSSTGVASPLASPQAAPLW